MTGLLGGKQKAATVAPGPAPQNRSSQEIADSAAAQRQYFYRSSNSRAQTNLTGGFGATTPAYSAVANLFGQSGT